MHIIIFCRVLYSTTAASFFISLRLIPGYETAKHGAATVHKIILSYSILSSRQETPAHVGQIPTPYH